MKKISGYIKSSWYNIRQNKAYTLFYVLGTALTFIFITIVLQLCLNITRENPPFVSAKRMFEVRDSYLDEYGNSVGGIMTPAIKSFMETVKGYDQYYITNQEWINVMVDGRIRSSTVAFVNNTLWSVNQYDFIEGKPFTKQDEDDRLPVAVVTQSFAESNYRNGSAIDKELEFQGNRYKIIGVIADYADVLNSHENCPSIWVSCVFNKFIPSYGNNFIITVLFNEDMSQYEMKTSLSNAVQFYFKNRDINVDVRAENIYSIQESIIKRFGSDTFSYGIGGILFFLLLIPAINIMTLSNTNINNRASEIAIRRAMGESQKISFLQIMIENLILVLIGTTLGVLLTYPTAELISSTLMGGSVTGDIRILTKVNAVVMLCGVLPLCLLFTLLSGGLPAYFISKRNISELLKGGSKW
ncbi:MAG: ABC transporter permease [Marinifilaceae bacterium]